MAFRSCCQIFWRQIRFMSKNKPKNHYNSLGITPKSTQGEVKAAYYKLSMIYHPDKNMGNVESAEKFRDITEAYEVLGNVNTRKLYDKGLYVGHHESPISSDDRMSRFHKSRDIRSRPPPPSGRTPIYDFDEWSKSHYGTTFRQKMENKRRSEEYQALRKQALDTSRLERTALILMFLAILSVIFFQDNSYDVVQLSTKSKSKIDPND